MNQGLFGIARSNIRTQANTFSEGDWTRCLAFSSAASTVPIRIPDNVEEVLVVAIGAGSGGSHNTTHGTSGAGGAMIVAVVPVTPGGIYQYTIGAGGVPNGGSGGGATTFGLPGTPFLSAGGGLPAITGTATPAAGGTAVVTVAKQILVKSNGGAGAATAGSASGSSPGGGSSGSPVGNGVAAWQPTSLQMAGGGSSWFATGGQGSANGGQGGGGVTQGGGAAVGSPGRGGGPTEINVWQTEAWSSAPTPDNFLSFLFTLAAGADYPAPAPQTSGLVVSVEASRGRSGGTGITLGGGLQAVDGSTVNAGDGGWFAGGGGFGSFASGSQETGIFRAGHGGFGGGGGGFGGNFSSSGAVYEGQFVTPNYKAGNGGIGGGGGANNVTGGFGGSGGNGMIAIYTRGGTTTSGTTNVTNVTNIVADDELNSTSLYYAAF